MRTSQYHHAKHILKFQGYNGLKGEAANRRVNRVGVVWIITAPSGALGLSGWFDFIFSPSPAAHFRTTTTTQQCISSFFTLVSIPNHQTPYRVKTRSSNSESAMSQSTTPQVEKKSTRTSSGNDFVSPNPMHNSTNHPLNTPLSSFHKCVSFSSLSLSLL